MDKHIGAQLYTLRDYTQNAKDFDLTLKKLKNIGYTAVQISAVGPIDTKEMKSICDEHGMKIYCTHKSYDDYKNRLKEIIEFHKILDTNLAGLGMIPKECLKDLDSLKEFIKQFNVISKELYKNGIYFGYHNHALEFVKIDGKFAYDYLIEETNPDEFKFIADTYWYAVAGLDPAKMIEKLGERAMAIHFKDLKATLENKCDMCEVMEGNLDWDSIIKSCDKAGLKWLLVEQDKCDGDPFDSLKISYTNLLAKGFC